MENPPLHVRDEVARVLFVPVPVQLLGYAPKLDDEVAGQILGLDLSALFAPEAEQGGLVVSHDDTGVRAAGRRELLPSTILFRLGRRFAVHSRDHGGFLDVGLQLVDSPSNPLKVIVRSVR